MPHGEDLYKPENIFAYTGDIDNNPSVYFKMDIPIDKGFQEVKYGHITQDHDNSLNIGRERVAQGPVYFLKNEYKKGTTELRNKEFAYLFNKDKNKHEVKSFHTSRNTHELIGPDDHEKRAKLAKAIGLFPDVKEKYIKTYVKEKIQEYKNDPDKEQKLDELDKKIDDITARKIEKNGDKKRKYEKQQKITKSEVNTEKKLVAKQNRKNRKNRIEKSNFLVAMNKDKEPKNDKPKVNSNDNSPKQKVNKKRKVTL